MANNNTKIPLTEKQINKILDGALDSSMHTNKRVRRLILEQQYNLLRFMLEDMRLKPKLLSSEYEEQTLKIIKEDIIRKFKRAQSSPGETVGTLAASSTSKPTMQMQLNTFHSAGSGRSMNDAFGRLSEIIRASKRESAKNITSYITFKNNDKTLEDIYLHERRNTVEVYLKNLITSYEILDPLDEDEDKIYVKLALLDPDVNTNEMNFRYQFVRVYLDTVYMTKYHISNRDIARAITGGKNEGFVVVVMHPFRQGVIDIHPTDAIADMKDKQADISEDSIAVIFNQRVIVPALETTVVKHTFSIHGVPGITGVYAKETPVSNGIYREVKLSQEGDNTTYRIEYDRSIVDMTSITREKINDSLETYGYVVETYNDIYAIVH